MGLILHPFRIERLTALLLGAVVSVSPAAEPVTGWRGNGTGLWPDATAPIEWHRLPHGALEGLRASAARPADPALPGEAPLVEKGLLRDWLVLGPFAVADSLADFDRDVLSGEADSQPAAGESAAGHAWTPATVPPDDITVFGTTELPWLDLAKAVGFQLNQLAYAHTYLFSPRGGPARIVAQHGEGMKAWLNGREVYRAPQRVMSVGWYHGLSRLELDHLHQPAARIDLELRPGWNRLLLKLSSPNREGFKDTQVNLRIMDPPDVPYESKNIRWLTELPDRSTSTPILVGDRIFVMAEPDELLCLDKHTGRILWSAANNYYEALSPDERAALPALAQRVDPLVAELRREPDRLRRLELRAAIQAALLEIDKERFAIPADDHFAAHFGIVGFTMPTPVSDGKYVYAWCGMGVAACYDVEGRRQWITRLPADELSYGASPALADGVLAVYLHELYGLDAATGKLLWTQHRVRKNIAAIMAARLAGESVFISQPGEIIRPADGELLFRPRGYATGDTGWSPPVVLGQKLFLPRYGVIELNVFDLAAPGSTLSSPVLERTISLPEEVGALPDGRRVDRWTPASPLIWQGLSYQIDIYQWLYVADVATGRMTHRQGLDLRGYMHYNAVPVAASPTLVGQHVMVFDNQGTAIVLEPGPTPRVVARNRIDTQLERWQPLPAQETLVYAPPIVDGDCLYLRGERYLYCIGE